MPRTSDDLERDLHKLGLAVIGCAEAVQSVKTKVENVEGKLDRVSDRTDAALNLFLGLKKQADAFRDEVNERFAQVNQRFDGMDQRFDGVDRQLDGIDQRLGTIEGLLRDLVAGPAARPVPAA